MRIKATAIAVLTTAYTVLAQNSTTTAPACPFAKDEKGPFEALTGTVLLHAKNFNIQITPYTAILTLGSKTLVLEACSFAGAVTPGAIVVPVASVSVMQDTVLPFIESLGQLSKVASIGKNLSTTACSMAAQPFTATAPVVFGPGGNDVAGLIATEKSPLAMGEWLLFFDAFFGFQGGAPEKLKDIGAQYSCIQNQVAAYKSSSGQTSNNLPVVVISATDLSSNKIVTPANAEFWRTLLRDAGASPQVASDGNTWAQMAKTADAVLDVTNGNDVTYNFQKWQSVYNLTATSSGYPFIRGFSSQVWRLDKRTADEQDDFAQSFASQPALLLMDVLSIFSTSFNPQYKQYWVKSLANGDIYTQVTAASCPNPPSLVLPLNGKYCDANTNKYAPTIGRFSNPTGKPTGATGSVINPSAGDSGWGAGQIAGVIILALVVFALFAFCALIYARRAQRKGEFGRGGGSSGSRGVSAPFNGAGMNSLREAVQKRRWFKMAEEEEADDVPLTQLVAQPATGGGGGARSQAGSEGNRAWQMEHGMPMFPAERGNRNGNSG
ncbi:hypothetical protein HDU78_010158 [Chytriomyces hyalinus]|nr:hypothetical protein HDU78_010158 [Chytriomyces hyalinus]